MSVFGVFMSDFRDFLLWCKKSPDAPFQLPDEIVPDFDEVRRLTARTEIFQTVKVWSDSNKN